MALSISLMACQSQDGNGAKADSDLQETEAGKEQSQESAESEMEI